MVRKQKTIHYIYKTTCLVTDRYYIGMHSTSNLDDGYMGSGLRLRRSIRKYGVENFKREIIEFFDTRELLIEAEKQAITPEMITDINCMNLKCGGTGGFISLEGCTKGGKKAGIIHKNKLNYNGKYLEKHNLKFVNMVKKNHELGKYKHDTMTDKKHSDKTKKLIGDKNKLKQKGFLNSQYGTCWITKEGINKKIKKESIDQYISEGWFKGHQ